MVLIISIFEITKIGIITKNPIIKLKKLAKVIESGANSRGNIACFKIDAQEKKEFVLSSTVLEKNIHGIIPESTKRV